MRRTAVRTILAEIRFLGPRHFRHALYGHKPPQRHCITYGYTAKYVVRLDNCFLPDCSVPCFLHVILLHLAAPLRAARGKVSLSNTQRGKSWRRRDLGLPILLMF